MTRPLEAILARRWAAGDAVPAQLRGCVFPAPSSASGQVEELQAHYGSIGRPGGATLWFHGLRNCFITVAERELMLPPSLTKRLVNNARPGDLTEGDPADWTVEQRRAPAQRIAELMGPDVTPEETHPPAR